MLVAGRSVVTEFFCLTLRELARSRQRLHPSPNLTEKYQRLLVRGGTQRRPVRDAHSLPTVVDELVETVRGDTLNGLAGSWFLLRFGRYRVQIESSEVRVAFNLGGRSR